ncbi:MAG: histidine phosphatase family protein [Acidimicrobiia bacterium]|nr:histidine phosphatase family protein [Acidimicrobiia bacterium]
MELLLIRHARPARVTSNGSADAGLTAEGARQAELLASLFTGTGVPRIDALYCSPMRRARETATPLADVTGLPVRVRDELAEFDHGLPDYIPSEERTDDRAQRLEALLAGRWDGHVFDLDAFRSRVITGIDAVAAEHPSRVVAVICHLGVINVYTAQVLGLPVPFFFEPDYTSITKVLVNRSGLRILRSANETPHFQYSGRACD